MIILAWLGVVAVMLNTGPCPGVIGVVYNQQGIVRDVYEGSPAGSAGIRVGDIILDRRSTRGKPQTLAQVKYIRDGVLRTVEVERVCVNELQGRSW